jgi:hypothetical protein
VKARARSAVAVIVLALAGCAEESPTPRHAEVSRTAWQNESNNGPWPFTVDRGILTCHAPDWVTFTASGTEYVLTDDARWLGHYEDVSAILVKGFVTVGDERQTVPAAYGALADRGRALCP